MTLVGIPYRRGGETRDGADCWGIVRLWYREELGIELPALAGADGADEEADRQRDFWRPVAPQEVRRGDLLLFRQPGRAVHCAVALGDGRMLHAVEGQASRIDRIAWPWTSWLVGVFRWAG